MAPTAGSRHRVPRRSISARLTDSQMAQDDQELRYTPSVTAGAKSFEEARSNAAAADRTPTATELTAADLVVTGLGGTAASIGSIS